MTAPDRDNARRDDSSANAQRAARLATVRYQVDQGDSDWLEDFEDWPIDRGGPS